MIVLALLLRNVMYRQFHLNKVIKMQISYTCIIYIMT